VLPLIVTLIVIVALGVIGFLGYLIDRSAERHDPEQ
jgi:hypothetical protein